MKENIFICYAREDYDVVTSFLYDFEEEAKNYKSNINLIIDKSRNVLNLGDKSKEKLQEYIQSSSGAVLFISNNFINSDFINNHEIPEILMRKKENSDFLIIPIFVDTDLVNIHKINKEILEYQSPNNEDQGLMELNPGLRELVIKKFAKEINEYFEKELNEDNQNIGKEPQKSPPPGPEEKYLNQIWGTSENPEKSKKLILRNAGILLIIALFYIFIFPSIQDRQPETTLDSNSGATSTSLATIRDIVLEEDESCKVILDYYNFFAINDKTYIELENEAFDTYENFLDIYNDFDYYFDLTSKEQKQLHAELNVYRFKDDIDELIELKNTIRATGIPNIAIEHIELKNQIEELITLQLSMIDDDIMIFTRYDEFFTNIEKAFEDVENANAEEADEIIDNFVTFNQEDEKQLGLLFDSSSAKYEELTTLAEIYAADSEELCNLVLIESDE